MQFEQDDEITALVVAALTRGIDLNNDETEDQFAPIADMTCTIGYDTDGSTVFEILENGVELARKAGNNQIYLVEETDGMVPNQSQYLTNYFFIGPKADIIQKLQKLLQ